MEENNLVKSILGICDQDVGYSNLLCENLSKRESFPFEISTFENVQSLTTTLLKRSITVVLISEEILAQVIENIGDDWMGKVKLIILDEGKGDVSNYWHIWKYQSSEKIRKELMEILSNSNEISISHRRENGNSFVLGVYSPFDGNLGGIGAIILGQIISKKEKVLVISLKEFSSINYYLNRNGKSEDSRGDEEKDITDLMYYLQSSTERFLCLYESMVMSIGDVDYIKPAYSLMDLKAINESDWIELLSELKKLGNYKYIVVEISNACENVFSLQRQCDVVLLLSYSNLLSENMIKNYEKYLEDNDYEDVMHKTSECLIPYEKDIPDRIQDLYRTNVAECIFAEINKMNII